jgi:hypothetical protein
MRKFLYLAVIGLGLLSFGFTWKYPVPLEGNYPLKLKTLTIFDLSSGEIPIFGSMAELTDSKPDFLAIDGIESQQFSRVKFGNFRFGNNEVKCWFMIAQNSAGYWDSFYLDQNLDNRLTKKEEIKSFQTNRRKKSGYAIWQADSLIPVSVKISYKGITREYQQNLYFFISTIAESKKDEYHVSAVAYSASFLEGEFKAATNKGNRLYKFIIIDADGNGCFNDYGKDLLFMNLRQDGSFHKNECQKLPEFFDSTGADKTIKQLRINLLPFSLKLGITEAISDFDPAQLEPPLSQPSDAKQESAPVPDSAPDDSNKAKPVDSGSGN